MPRTVRRVIHITPSPLLPSVAFPLPHGGRGILLSVCTEPVEVRFFFARLKKAGACFDKLFLSEVEGLGTNGSKAAELALTPYRDPTRSAIAV